MPVILKPEMSLALQVVAKKIQDRLLTAGPGTASRDILTLVGELVDALQSNTEPDPKDAIISKLQAEVASLNALQNNDAATFLSIKTALGNLDLTQGELANEITTKWRRI